MKKLSVLVTAAVLAVIMVFGSSAQVLAAKPDRIDFGNVKSKPSMVRLT